MAIKCTTYLVIIYTSYLHYTTAYYGYSDATAGSWADIPRSDHGAAVILTLMASLFLNTTLHSL